MSTRTNIITDTARRMNRRGVSATNESISEYMSDNEAAAAYIDSLNCKQWASLKTAIRREVERMAAVDASNARIFAKLAAK